MGSPTVGKMLGLALPFSYSFISTTALEDISCNPSLQERELRHRDLPSPSPSEAWQSPRLNQACLALLPPAFRDPEPGGLWESLPVRRAGVVFSHCAPWPECPLPLLVSLVLMTQLSVIPPFL